MKKSTFSKRFLPQNYPVILTRNARANTNMPSESVYDPPLRRYTRNAKFQMPAVRPTSGLHTPDYHHSTRHEAAHPSLFLKFFSDLGLQSYTEAPCTASDVHVRRSEMPGEPTWTSKTAQVQPSGLEKKNFFLRRKRAEKNLSRRSLPRRARISPRLSSPTLRFEKKIRGLQLAVLRSGVACRAK
jgi:hypothetical protein